MTTETVPSSEVESGETAVQECQASTAQEYQVADSLPAGLGPNRPVLPGTEDNPPLSGDSSTLPDDVDWDGMIGNGDGNAVELGELIHALTGANQPIAADGSSVIESTTQTQSGLVEGTFDDYYFRNYGMSYEDYVNLQSTPSLSAGLLDAPGQVEGTADDYYFRNYGMSLEDYVNLQGTPSLSAGPLDTHLTGLGMFDGSLADGFTHWDVM